MQQLVCVNKFNPWWYVIAASGYSGETESEAGHSFQLIKYENIAVLASQDGQLVNYLRCYTGEEQDKDYKLCILSLQIVYLTRIFQLSLRSAADEMLLDCAVPFKHAWEWFFPRSPPWWIGTKQIKGGQVNSLALHRPPETFSFFLLKISFCQHDIHCSCSSVSSLNFDHFLREKTIKTTRSFPSKRRLLLLYVA